VNILDVTPTLTVTAIGPAIAFYRDILGFECVNEMDGGACVSFEAAGPATRRAPRPDFG
jgi:catechol 2,3-dioxygenase-like lactoylglutathione lyase family enzyme